MAMCVCNKKVDQGMFPFIVKKCGDDCKNKKEPRKVDQGMFPLAINNNIRQIKI
jgi:hypothetical protein